MTGYLDYGPINILSAFPLAYAPAQYRCTHPHYGVEGDSAYYVPGTILTEGVNIPFGWVPTLAVDPLNNPAVVNFYNAGPRDLVTAPSNDVLNWDVGLPVITPVTYWVPVKAAPGSNATYFNYGPINIMYGRINVGQPPGQWKLTGLGALLPPRFAVADTGVRYISSSGDDANDGTTPTAAWKTIGMVNTQAMGPGSSYLFHGGDTFSDATLTIRASGVTVGSYGTGQATISRTSGQAIAWTNLSSITISNLILAGSATATYGIHGVYNTGSNTDISISNITASGFSETGISISSDGTSNVGFLDRITISNCVVTACVQTGIAVDAGRPKLGGFDQVGTYFFSNLTVSNCVVHNITGAAGSGGSGIYTGSVGTGLITGCVTYSNGVSGGGNVGIWSFDCSAVTYRYCESYNNLSTGADGDGFDLDGACINCVIEYCYAHGNANNNFLFFGGPTSSGNTMRFCLSQNAQLNAEVCVNVGTVGPSGQNDVANFQCYNNTLYISGNPNNFAALNLVAFTGTKITGHFSNNILMTDAVNNCNLIWANGDFAPVPGDFLLAGNDYFSTGSFLIFYTPTHYTSFASWQTATNQEKISAVNVGKTSNPLLANPGNGGTANTGGAVTPAQLRAITAYLLTHGTPMFQTGLDLASQFGISLPSVDYYGNVISASTLSIGADCPINAP